MTDPRPGRVSYAMVHHLPGRVRLRVPRLKSDHPFARRLASLLPARPGIRFVRVAPVCASLVVEYDPQFVSIAQIGAWLQEALDHEQAVPPPSQEARPELSGLVSGGIALGLSLLGAPAGITAAFLAVSAAPIVARATYSLTARRHISADALDATAVGLLATRGNIFAASLSSCLIAGGEYIRALTARRSRRALVDLLASTNRYAWLVRGGQKERVPVSDLQPGDTVVVYPGESLSADGVVVRGRGLVDQKMLTGESMPVLRQRGDGVYAFTLLADGKLYVRAERVGPATRAQQVIQVLEAAPRHDTRIANYASLVADRLVLPTLGLAGAVYALSGNLTRAVSVIVFDFATGIRVAAPTTVLASMTAAARDGLLIKGGRALEQLARVDTLVFDKTGTLTAGTPALTDVRSLALNVSEGEVLALAAAAERRLSHPVARAIMRGAEELHLPVPERTDSHYTVGLGVEAAVNGCKVHVGDERYLRRLGIGLPAKAAAAAEEAAERGASTVFVARDGCPLGLISYADSARPEAQAVLSQLRDRGIRRLVMVTGDVEQVARAVAHEVGIDRVVAGVFPEEKVEIVRDLQSHGHVVGFIGDGINDSPALAYADVSFSLKAGTDVARETADIVLHGDLGGLPTALDISRECMALIRQNIGIIVVPNAIGMMLAALGVIGPLAATALNNGSSVIAGLHSLRPLAAPRPRRP